MSHYTPASEILLRNDTLLHDAHVLSAGDLQDNWPAQAPAQSVCVHTQQFHHWQRLTPLLGERVQFGLLPTAALTQQVDTLLYYWPKNKAEALFQLTSLLSQLPAGTRLLITGENRSGVRSAPALLAEYATLQKIDSARRCSLWYGQLVTPPIFSLAECWQTYQVDGLPVKTLPGVFSRQGLDEGSALLLSTFTAPLSGRALDVGCGAGVLSATIGRRSPALDLTLCDVSAPALASSEATLAASQLTGTVIASNIYSSLSGKFDLIFSNPPFHDGLHLARQPAETLIREAPRWLKPGGELRLVANAFLPYADLLDSAFGNHRVLAETTRYKVYSAVLNTGATANRTRRARR